MSSLDVMVMRKSLQRIEAADEIFQQPLLEWRASDVDALAGLMERLVVDLRHGTRQGVARSRSG
jgi:hypothetical protein